MRDRRRSLAVCAAAVAALGVLVAPATTTQAASTTPSVTLTATSRDLGTLGGARSSATDMDGNRVVGASTTIGGDEHAFVYDVSTSTMRDLGTLGGSTSAAVAIDGSVVVGSSRTAAGDTHAFAYDLAASTPSMKDLGTLGGPTSEAVDVAGGVVAGTSGTPGHGERAWMYDLNETTPTMRDLGTFGYFDFTRTTAMDGTLVAGIAGSSAGGEEHAFSYDVASGTGMRDLGTLGFDFSQAVDVDGDVVVGKSLTSTFRFGDEGQHAFAYDLSATSPAMRDLGDLGYDWSQAALVSDHRVVGVSRRSHDGPMHAFSYDLAAASPRMRDLGNLGGRFIVPRALSGNVLVGRAARAADDQPRAFAYDFGASAPAMADLGPLGGNAGDVVAVQGDTVAGTVVNAAGSPRATLWTLRRTTAPAFRFSTSTYRVRENSRRAVITVRRGGVTTRAVSVRYAARAVSATAGKDFRATSGLLRFSAEQTRATFSVPVLDDAAPEKAEAVLLTLDSPSSGALLGTPNAAAMVIQPSDQRPDAWVSNQPSSTFAGNNVFNTTGDRQTKTQTARRSQTRSFYVRVYNDGNVTNTFTLHGSLPGRASVRFDTGRPGYLDWTRDVTRAMRSSVGLRVSLAPHQFQRIRVQVAPLRTAPIGSRQVAALTATWRGDVTRSDRVKAVVRTVR